MVVTKVSVSLLVISQGTLAVTLKIASPASTATAILVLSVESCLATPAWVRVMVHTFGRPCFGGSERKDSISGDSRGIFFVCDGNFLISASREVRNSGNPTDRGRLGDIPRHIGCHVEGGTCVIGVDGYTGFICRECSCRSRLGDGNGHTFALPCFGGSERKDSLSGGSRGIYLVCDGNFLISASRFVRNSGNPIILGSFGDTPRHIGCHVEDDACGIGVDGYTGLISSDLSCRSRLCEGNGHTFTPSCGGSERNDSISGGNSGIFFVCDGNSLISVSRKGRNGNKSILGSFGDTPIHIGAHHLEGNISCRGSGGEDGRSRRQHAGTCEALR